MICSKCGTTNNDDALFCSDCGIKLGKPEPSDHGRACPECGLNNPADGRFCARCGAGLRHHRPEHAHQHVKVKSSNKHKKGNGHVNTKLKWHPGFVGIVLLAGVFAFIVGMELFVKKQPSPPNQFMETKSGDTKLEAKVLEIASKFICSCGTCGEKPLDTCTCNRAVEERQLIRNYLEQGQKPEQIVVALNNTYGWIKPEFAALVGDTTGASVAAVKNNLTKAKPDSFLPPGGLVNIGGAAKVATAADRLKIFSQFKCPCGQCGVDELKDCGCQHPRGATEVKAFVDAKIAEGKYTVAQLIDILDGKYGGRKF